MEYYVGLDISLRSCALCIVDSKGIVHFERELPCDVEDISACLKLFEYQTAKRSVTRIYDPRSFRRRKTSLTQTPN